MNINIYMTKQEQRIFSAISSIDIVTIEEIKDLLPDLKAYQINKTCSSLSSKGYLYRLKRGTYLLQEKPFGADAPSIKNPYRIALTLFKGYIGFSSALRIYDLLDYEPFTIFVATQIRSASKSIGEYVFKAVAMGAIARGMTFHRGTYVSTLTKTFFECFYKPQYAGGYSTITKALFESRLGWKEFMGYFDTASSSLCQRTGYVLNMLGKETGKVPKVVLTYLRKRIKNNTKLLPSGKSVGRYSRDWMVLDNLGKENILSWWYHG